MRLSWEYLVWEYTYFTHSFWHSGNLLKPIHHSHVFGRGDKTYGTHEKLHTDRNPNSGLKREHWSSQVAVSNTMQHQATLKVLLKIFCEYFGISYVTQVQCLRSWFLWQTKVRIFFYYLQRLYTFTNLPEYKQVQGIILIHVYNLNLFVTWSWRKPTQAGHVNPTQKDPSQLSGWNSDLAYSEATALTMAPPCLPVCKWLWLLKPQAGCY